MLSLLIKMEFSSSQMSYSSARQKQQVSSTDSDSSNVQHHRMLSKPTHTYVVGTTPFGDGVYPLNRTSEYNNSDNVSTTTEFDWSTPYSPTFIVLVGLIMVLFSLITIVGNLMVLISFYIDKKIREPSNYFIFSLALSDFMIGLEGFPLYSVYVLNGEKWTMGSVMCDFWLSVDYAVCLASIYTVLFITIDRFCSVKIPTKYRNWRTKKKALLIVILIWIVPTLLFFISVFGWEHFTGSRILAEHECQVQFMKSNPYFNMSMYIAYYWSTLVVMIVLYAGIYKAAKRLQAKSQAKQRRLAAVKAMQINFMVGVGPRFTDPSQYLPVNDENHREEVKTSYDPSFGSIAGGSTKAVAEANSLINNILTLNNAENKMDDVQCCSKDDEHCDSSATYKERSTSSKSLNEPTNPKESDTQVVKEDALVNEDDEKRAKMIVDRICTEIRKRNSVRISETSSKDAVDDDEHKKRLHKAVRMFRSFYGNSRWKGRKPKNVVNVIWQNNVTHRAIEKIAEEPQMQQKKRLTCSQSEGFMDYFRGKDFEDATGDDSSDQTVLSQHPTNFMDDNVYQTAPENSQQCTSFYSCKSLADSNDNDSLGFIDSTYVSSSNSLKSIQDALLQRTPTAFISLLEDLYGADELPEDVLLKRNNALALAIRQAASNLCTLVSEDDGHWIFDGNNQQVKTPSETFSIKAQIEEEEPLVDAEEEPAQCACASTALVEAIRDSDLHTPLIPKQLPFDRTSEKGDSDDDSNSGEQRKNSKTAEMDFMKRPSQESGMFSCWRFRTPYGPHEDARNEKPSRTLFSLCHRKKQQASTTYKQSKSENRARKALRTITIILGAFVLFWTPFYVLATMYGFCDECIPSWLFITSYYMCYMNSPINPFCYAMANMQFKKTLSRMLRGDFHRA